MIALQVAWRTQCQWISNVTVSHGPRDWHRHSLARGQPPEQRLRGTLQRRQVPLQLIHAVRPSARALDPGDEARRERPSRSRTLARASLGELRLTGSRSAPAALLPLRLAVPGPRPPSLARPVPSCPGSGSASGAPSAASPSVARRARGG
eukprot:1332195-Rhodomonas_salina.4